MMDGIINKFKKFREDIYHFFSSRKDASFELIDALSSNTSAQSVVALSLNPVHRRNYCSITRVVDEFYSNDPDKKIKNAGLTKIISTYTIAQKERKYILFAVDCTPNPRRYASTQKDRGFVYAPNTISGNKPVTMGHQYSVVAFLPEKTDECTSPWIVPLSCRRVITDEKSSVVGMQQMSQCIQSQPEFKNQLCVTVADSAYSHSNQIFESNKNVNQIHISRVRNGIRYIKTQTSFIKSFRT